MSWNIFRTPKQTPPTPPPAPASFEEQMSSPLSAVNALIRENTPSFPVEATFNLFTITDQITVLIDRSNQEPLLIDDRIAVEFMLTDYIPATIQAFLTSRLDLSVKGPEMIKQVGLLKKKSDDMITAVHAADNARLEMNGRFLQDKFGRPTT